LIDLLHDSERFLFEFYDTINLSALHVYYSALPFAPKHTLLYEMFKHELQDSTKVMSGVSDSWNAYLRTIEHPSVVRSVAISHDGTQIISGSDDNTVRIWDAQTGAAVHELKGHSSHVYSVAISHDGTQIISGSADKTVRIWDAQTGAAVHELKGHSSVVTSVAISHDGTQIISGSDDDTVRIWDAQTGAAVHELKGHSSFVYSVAISHDGTQIISGSHCKGNLTINADIARCLQGKTKVNYV
jgi:WD40 repeat protein